MICDSIPVDKIDWQSNCPYFGSPWMSGTFVAVAHQNEQLGAGSGEFE
jgi:hypothetical protein